MSVGPPEVRAPRRALHEVALGHSADNPSGTCAAHSGAVDALSKRHLPADKGMVVDARPEFTPRDLESRRSIYAGALPNADVDSPSGESALDRSSFHESLKRIERRTPAAPTE